MSIGLFMVMIAYGVLQIYAGYVGIEYQLGGGWAIAAVVATLIFRSSIFMVIGAFICALYVWEWHWVWAILFAAPGILLLVPGIVMGLVEKARDILRG